MLGASVPGHRRTPACQDGEVIPMLATDTNVMTPARPLVEGPSVWFGPDMRAREAEWSYRLSSSEIAEIDSAVQEVRHRGLELADIRREDFPLPTLG
jgi:hypothetical protein